MTDQSKTVPAVATSTPVGGTLASPAAAPSLPAAPTATGSGLPTPPSPPVLPTPPVPPALASVPPSTQESTSTTSNKPETTASSVPTPAASSSTLPTAPTAPPSITFPTTPPTPAGPSTPTSPPSSTTSPTASPAAPTSMFSAPPGATTPPPLPPSFTTGVGTAPTPPADPKPTTPAPTPPPPISPGPATTAAATPTMATFPPAPPLPPNPPAATSSPTPTPPPPPSGAKKKSALPKIIGLALLLIVALGGSGVAYLLSQQGQDVRQEAATPSDYPPKQFTLQHLNAEVETFEASNAPDYAPSSVNLKIDFVPSAPNCGTTMSCTADVRATLVDDAGAPALPENCTINTASLVYYRFLTDTTSTYYPDNLTYNNFDPGGWGNANCNRPVSQCAADPNCDTKVINPIYGPPSSQCGPEGCLYFQTQTEFSITNTEYGCGCIQFDVNISNMSLNCTSRDGQSTTVSYRRTSNNGPWAYGYNTDRCEEPVPTATVTPTPQATNTPTPTPTTPASATATPTPTSPPNATATPTATPAPFGEMCLDITANPAAPKYNDAVTFTCAAVAGVESYQFRYFEPSTLTPTALATREKNVSQPLTVNKAGEYTVQCRICPPATATNQYCNDPNWGWDPIVTTQVRE